MANSTRSNFGESVRSSLYSGVLEEYAHIYISPEGVLQGCLGVCKPHLVRVGIFSWLFLANPTGVLGSQCCRKAIKIG